MSRTEKTEKYRTISGETIEYIVPTGELATFLRRVRDAVNDPSVTEDALTDLIYGRENPLLDQTIFKNRGAVTKATFADPIYHVMLDLLGQKRVQEKTLDLDKVAERYTLTVAQAAERAGVHESAIRQAIAAKRLPTWKKRGRYMLSAEDIDNYRPAGRGPVGALDIIMGAKPGASLHVHHRGGALKRIMSHGPPGQTGRSVHATISQWERVAVLTGTQTGARCFILEPSEAPDEIHFSGYHVRGRFKKVETINNEVKARAVFKSFKSNVA